MAIETGTELARCEICAAATAPYFASQGSYDYHRCEQCGFVFLSPMPSDEALHAVYNEDYRDISAEFYPKANSRRHRTFWKSMRFLPYITGKRVLDIGCGGGFMTNAFRRWSASASGVDISEPSLAYARAHFPRCTFYCEGFEAFAKRGLEFDFVFSTELLEHIPAARPFMSVLDAVTRPGAHVYIATPDAGHPAVPRKFTDWIDVQPPHHVQFFNRENVTKLFADYGFELQRAFAKKKPALSLLFVRRH
jgi:2-polyprenyl-3-methyl-5-hydroxy-6-metoxy-1,4-benzoquinol methylase